MDGLFSLLLFAVFFYLMMRFGCGAHMVHGGHGGHGRHAGPGSGDPKHVDPVCGRTLEPEQGYGKMHAGNLYRFCSRQCLDAFEANPERYTAGRQEVTS